MTDVAMSRNECAQSQIHLVNIFNRYRRGRDVGRQEVGRGRNRGEVTLSECLPTLILENQRRRHQKSKTGVSVAPQKDLCPPKIKRKHRYRCTANKRERILTNRCPSIRETWEADFRWISQWRPGESGSIATVSDPANHTLCWVRTFVVVRLFNEMEKEMYQ